LLATSESFQIETHFPRPLPDLTIDFKFILTDPLVSARMSPTTLQQTHFALVRIASESLECALILQSGEIVVYRLSSGPHEEAPHREASDNELIILEHIPRCHDRRFFPFLLLAPDKGAVTAFSLSDIGRTLLQIVVGPTYFLFLGFLASAYADGSLLVVDMRFPRILLRHEQQSQAKSRHIVSLHPKRHSKSVDLVDSLTWTVTTVGSGMFHRHSANL
jgi:syntaxin-binding protein 5